jgi:hypothetical protein
MLMATFWVFIFLLLLSIPKKEYHKVFSPASAQTILMIKERLRGQLHSLNVLTATRLQDAYQQLLTMLALVLWEFACPVPTPEECEH